MNPSLDFSQRRLRELADLALEILPSMADHRARLFSHKTVVRNSHYVNHGLNSLYSAVSLVGLLRQKRQPVDDVVPLGRLLDGVHEAVDRSARESELANLVWASSLADDCRGGAALQRLVDLRPHLLLSADLGQALHGLATGADAYPGRRDAAIRTAQSCADELLRRFSRRADLFGALPRRFPPRRELVENGITSFAAQVYPLHGLAALHRMTGESPPEEMKLVAERLVEAQGELGQWWWCYSTRNRSVLEGYPVYSVHQDGMAYLGLVELESLGVGQYSAALAKGLRWLDGDNELSADMVRRTPPIIHRCIQRTGSDADGVFGLSRANFFRLVVRSWRPWTGRDHTDGQAGDFEVLQECRSYHLGWLLYAHSLIENASSTRPSA